MLRITVSGYRQVRTVDLDGKLIGPWVDELRLALNASDDPAAVCLNLQRLTFADAAGLALLHELHHNGTQLVGALPLLRELLALPTQLPDRHVIAQAGG